MAVKINGTRKDMAKQRVAVGELIVGGLSGTRFVGERDDGTNWYVNSVTGASTNDGKSPNSPRASLASVLDDATIAANDSIWCMAGHVETVTAAAGLDIDTAGLTIYFLGNGANRAQITFTTATTADMDIDAANITLVNPLFVAGIDALAAPIDVNAADFTIYDGECRDAAAVAASIWVIGDANADRMIIDGWTFLDSTTGTQKTENIRIVGADDVILKNVRITGDFSISAINNVTTAAPNLYLENVTVINSNTTPAPGITLVAATTGWGKNVSVRIASGGVTGVTPVTNASAMNWDATCTGVAADGSGQGNGIGKQSALFVPGWGYNVVKLGNVATSTDDLFVVSGKCIVTALVGEVTSVVATTTSLQLVTSVGSRTLCASTDIVTEIAGTLYVVTGDQDEVLSGTTQNVVGFAMSATRFEKPLFMINDNVIVQSINGAGTGLIEWNLYYIPVEAGASITSAA